jgi:hypothetical protein
MSFWTNSGEYRTWKFISDKRMCAFIGVYTRVYEHLRCTVFFKKVHMTLPHTNKLNSVSEMREFIGDAFREKKRRKINSENVPQKGSRYQHSKMDARSKKLSSRSNVEKSEYVDWRHKWTRNKLQMEMHEADGASTNCWWRFSDRT